MHSRRDVEVNDEAMLPVELFVDDDNTSVTVELGNNGSRGSWRKSCAAKRSIERIREERYLKEMLEDAFDDDEHMDYSELDDD